MSAVIVKSLAAIRMLVGVSFLATPVFAGRLFMLPFTPATTIIARLFGSRDLALGGLLWTAQPGDERRRALTAGIVTDAVDALATGACLLEGNIDPVPGAVVGGGAATLMATGLVALRDRRSSDVVPSQGS